MIRNGLAEQKNKLNSLHGDYQESLDQKLLAESNLENQKIKFIEFNKKLEEWQKKINERFLCEKEQRIKIINDLKDMRIKREFRITSHLALRLEVVSFAKELESSVKSKLVGQNGKVALSSMIKKL